MGQNITLLEESQDFPSRPSDSCSIGRQAKPGNLLRIVRTIRHTAWAKGSFLNGKFDDTYSKH
jgi:hypothetical protein